MVAPHPLLRARLRSQLRTAEPSTLSVAAAARHMLAVQGQDPVAALWALGVRSEATQAADIRAAQGRGEIVRSWPMRSTVHLVPAEDIGWMQRLLTPRIASDVPRRREFLGLPDETVERMGDIAAATLTGGRSLSRADLVAEFERRGIEMQTGWSYHCIWWLCQTGTLTFGPPLGARDAQLVLADEWITAPRLLEGDEALEELAARYLVGHGPASPADLAWWTKLSLTQARAALALAVDAGRAEVQQIDGTKWWAAPGAFDEPLPDGPEVMLLPAFDELLLGYRDRSLSADAAHTKLLMSVNGIAAPTVMSDGRAVGTWKLVNGAVEVTAFDRVTQPGKRSLAAAITRVEGFYAA